MSNQATDEAWMRQALEAARVAGGAGEVPVGAVLVREGALLAQAHNAPIAQCDPTAHAEIQALRAGARLQGNYRLEGCTLYVTLEPCAMCSSALLQARVARVVFGAPEPKTGAAGSVLDVFADPRLNHQTQVQGGVLEAECAALLQDFFRQRRQAQRRAHQAAHPLRQDALRTPQACFAHLPGPPWEGQYVSDLPALAGLRLHGVQMPPAPPALPATPHAGPARVWLLLHAPDSWSWALRHLAQALAQAGQCVCVPDLIGFGRSDKPKKHTLHTVHWHAQVLAQWLAAQHSAARVLLVTQGAPSAALWLGQPSSAHWPLEGWLQLDTLSPSPASQAALAAPYPDAGHRAGPQALGRALAAAAPVCPPALVHRRARLPEDAGQAATLVQHAMEYFPL